MAISLPGTSGEWEQAAGARRLLGFMYDGPAREFPELAIPALRAYLIAVVL